MMGVATVHITSYVVKQQNGRVTHCADPFYSNRFEDTLAVRTLGHNSSR